MKRLFILLTATLALCCSAAAQLTKEDEDLLRFYGASEQYIQEQREKQAVLAQEAAEKKQRTRTLVLALSLAVAAGTGTAVLLACKKRKKKN